MWVVQRQKVKGGFYYSAVQKVPNGPSRSVTVRAIEGSPETLPLTERLRRWDRDGVWDDETVRRVVLAPDDDSAARVVLQLHLRPQMRVEVVPDLTDRVASALVILNASEGLARTRDPMLAPLVFGDSPTAVADGLAAMRIQAPATRDQPPSPVSEPAAPPPPTHPSGAMTLRDFVDGVWAQERCKQAATWGRERGWWDRHLLPALGDLRLCDLSTQRWSGALAGLTQCGGRSKAIAQVAYRTALKHAASLGWIEAVHPFPVIVGSTKRTLLPPEPPTMPEVAAFLNAVSSPRDRAMFGLQFGQGLRPAEVLPVRWEDIDWRRARLHVRGTKNALAEGVVALTRLSVSELSPWWEAAGKPAAGLCFPSQRPGKAGAELATYPTRSFRVAADASGLNALRQRALFPYIARHAFATIAAMSGVDRAATRRMMRHSTTSTILESAYEHASLQQTADAFRGYGPE